MVPEKYRFESVGRFLIESFEHRRPALEAWTPAVEEKLRADAEVELSQMERQCRELGVDDPDYWKRVRGVLQTVLLPRYGALARAEIALSRRDYGLWRGGDLVARMTFAAAGLVLGALTVAIPWIPVTEKWVPWALFIAGPLLPDAYFWWYRRRYRRSLEGLLTDLARAGSSLDTYRPLSELQRAFGEPPPLREGSLEGPAESGTDEIGQPPGRVRH